jgi:hypothetical protein
MNLEARSSLEEPVTLDLFDRRENSLKSFPLSTKGGDPPTKLRVLRVVDRENLKTDERNTGFGFLRRYNPQKVFHL